MPDLTLEQVDAAILKATGDTLVGYERRIALAILTLAAQIADPARALPAEGYEYGEGWDAGHDAHQRTIRDTVRRLRKEMKNAD